MITLVRARYDAPLAAPLVRALDEELWSRYPGTEGSSPHAPEMYAPPRGAFVVALVDGTPRAIGAFEIVAANELAEVHRMFVAPAARGAGYAKIPCFGRFAQDPTSVCFEKAL